MTARNVVVDRGEIDLIVDDRGVRVAVEVRTRLGGADPIDAADEAKRDRVRKLARRVGAARVDVIGVRVDRDGFDIHWVPAV